MPNSKTRRGRAMQGKGELPDYLLPVLSVLRDTGQAHLRGKNGQITIKGQQYPIKLMDGYYIIRKLTVLECMRLQTVPEGFRSQ